MRKVLPTSLVSLSSLILLTQLKTVWLQDSVGVCGDKTPYNSETLLRLLLTLLFLSALPETLFLLGIFWSQKKTWLDDALFQNQSIFFLIEIFLCLSSCIFIQCKSFSDERKDTFHSLSSFLRIANKFITNSQIESCERFITPNW